MRVLTDQRYNIRLELMSGQSLNEPVTGVIAIDTNGMAQNQITPNQDFYINTMDNGLIAGKLTENNILMRDGNVVFVSTFSMAATPPDITPQMRNQGLQLYSGVADVDGKYSIRVPVGSNYCVTGWQNGVKKEFTNITVTAGSTVTKDLVWP
jgi:hypothetical protein